MKVRAIEDGTYGGYFRHGPVVGADGTIPGEVFEISNEIVELREPSDFDGTPGKVQLEPAKDKNGRPIIERIETQAVDSNGNPVVDAKTHKPVMVTTQQPKMAPRTTTHFNPKWMVQVPEDTQTTYDYPPFEIPTQYRKPKDRTVKAAPVPNAENANLLPVI